MRAVQSEVYVHIDFLLEEPSAEAALGTILPRILSDKVSYNFRVFKGKGDLLNKLPERLKTYRRWIPDDWRIFVLIDEDRQNCHELKATLERAADEAGFVTKSRVISGRDFQVVNRLAIEELEAWFFGDVEAMHAAYPKIPINLQSKAKYRNPDAILGGTYEALEHLLIQSNYYQERVHKPTVAQNIAQYMEPSRNRSKIFRCFLKDSKHA